MRRHTGCVSALLVLLGFCLFGNAVPAQATDFFLAYLLDEANNIQAGDDIEIRFEVDETAQQFNAFEITIQFDPSIVSFVSVARGELMTEACGNILDFWDTTDSTVFYSLTLLCQDVSVDGPGVCARFTFHGENDGTSPLMITSDPDRCFFDEGYFIWPGHPTLPRQVVLHNASITVGEVQGIEDLPHGSLFEIQIAPNPIHGSGWIQGRLPLSSRDGSIEILNVSGRRLRSWSLSSDMTGGAYQIPWGVRDLDGRPLPTGTYFYRAQSGTDTQSGSFVVVR